MSDPLVISISHSLGKEEAIRRLKAGIGDIGSTLSRYKIAIADHEWVGDTAHFSVKALGQTVLVRADVQEASVRIEAHLPWLLGVFAKKIRLAVEKNAPLLLEKK